MSIILHHTSQLLDRYVVEMTGDELLAAVREHFRAKQVAVLPCSFKLHIEGEPVDSDTRVQVIWEIRACDEDDPRKID